MFSSRYNMSNMDDKIVTKLSSQIDLKLSTKFFLAIAAFTWCNTLVNAAKVIELNENLLELVEKHSEKNWLIKFYAPWCYHCQQLEPTYQDVAESIYHNHETLIVGRVDCTKSGRVCERFGVNSYPTIMFINSKSRITYRGDRSESSIIAFANRLQGPTINLVHTCQELSQAIDQHGLIILSTISDMESTLRGEFESLAHFYKSTYWFYQFNGECNNLIEREGLFVLKQHLNRPVRFEPPKSSDKDTSSTSNLTNYMVEWLNRESFPVYTQISFRNIERVLATRKLLVISILDEYKPAQRFTPTSREFYGLFELLAREYTQTDNDVMFGWSSELDLIGYITITPINLIPNVMILKSDYSYHLLLTNDSDFLDSEKSYEKINRRLLEKLNKRLIKTAISDANQGKLVFSGGDTYLFFLMRYIMGNINKFLNMYRANPLLVSVIFGFPSLIIVFVIYTTCFYEGKTEEEEDEGYSDSEFEDDYEPAPVPSKNHLKQE